MFTPGNKIRHVSSLDLDLVVHHKEEHQEHYELEVFYWNRFYNNFCIDEPDTIIILKKDVSNWSIVND